QSEARAPDQVLAALGDANRALLAAHPAADVAAEVRRRAARAATAGGRARPARPARGLWIGLPLAAAGALGAALLLTRPAAPLAPPGVTTAPGVGGLEPTNIKGGGATGQARPRVIVYRQ